MPTDVFYPKNVEETMTAVPMHLNDVGMISFLYYLTLLLLASKLEASKAAVFTWLR